MMDVALIEALRQANLDPGTYRCRINGHEVVVQVKPSRPLEAQRVSEEQSSLQLAEPVTIDESCIMLDPWVELPGPEPIGKVIARLAPPPPPDIPEIPAEDETP
jgi:hypothetical protein